MTPERRKCCFRGPNFKNFPGLHAPGPPKWLCGPSKPVIQNAGSAPALCHCGRTESLIHLFTDCPFAIQLIDWYFSVYKRFRPQSQRPSKCDILVGYGKNVKVPPVFPCLLGLIRHHIWLTRNKARFDKVMPHYPTVLSRVKSALRCVVRVQQRHCLPANFSDFWLASGVVGILSAGDIIVFAAEFRD